MSNPNYGSVATTTIESRTRQLADNITNNSALLMRLKKRGNRKTVSGGRLILQEIDYAVSANTGWYSGYDTLATAATDTATAAEFTIKELYASVTISGLEMAQNRSKEQFIPLLTSKVRNAERSMNNVMNTGVYSDGTGTSGKQLGGLALLVASAPATGTVGGINRATATWWRNKAFRSSVDYGGAATSATILNHMGRTYNALVRGNDVPDLSPADGLAYQLFMDALTDRQVIMDDEVAKAGFVTAKFRTMDVVLDGGVGGAIAANTIFFLNTDYLHFRPMEGMDMYRVGGDREPTNQDSIIRIVGWKGNMTASGCQYMAVMRTD
jgi:hypothetical protein